MLHLLGRIRFSKSSRDTAHCRSKVSRCSLQWLAYEVSRTGRHVLGERWQGAPTEAPAPSPGQLCHRVLLCFSASMGASAAQEWGVPCALSPEEHLPRSVRGR
ncbi:hypothetical protein VULLAG_LOCUS23131 [Vulpes lagopus]